MQFQIRNFTQIIKNLPEPDDYGLAKYQDKVKLAVDEIKEEIKAKKLPVLNIATINDDLEEINNIADKIRQQFNQVVVLGIGGSSLGAKTLVAIKDQALIAIDFLESIDSSSLQRKLAKINWDKTFFLVISKSGETVETICQTLIIIEKFKDQEIARNLSEHFLFITEDHQNSIARIAAQIGAKIYFHPKNIGGRFSYLTVVGLLPAAIVGLDIGAIRDGAAEILDYFINQNYSKNGIAAISTLQIYLFDNGFIDNVMMPYIDALEDFVDWYRQIWSESLGKNNFAPTPIKGMGTVDQHSQLQLYLAGPKNKFFTFINNRNIKNNFKIIDLPNCPTRFGGKNLQEIMQIEFDSTIQILEQNKLPMRIWELDNGLDERILGGLMMQIFLETMIIAKVRNINPFDQEEVEKRKELAKRLIGGNLI